MTPGKKKNEIHCCNYTTKTQTNIMTTAETTMNVYVPICFYGREKYEYEADTLGVFRNKSDAVNALLQYLIDNQKISSSNFETEPDDDDEEIKYFGNIVNSDFENLIKVCKEYGDSFFNDGWKIRIDNFTVM